MELSYTLSREELHRALTLINQKNLNRAGYRSSFCLIYGVILMLVMLRLAAVCSGLLPAAAYPVYLLALILFLCACKWGIPPLSDLTVRGVIRMQVRGKWGKRLCGSHRVTFTEQAVVLDEEKPFLWTRAYYVMRAEDLLLVTGRRGKLLVCSFAGLSPEERQAYCDYLDQYVYLLEDKNA